MNIILLNLRTYTFKCATYETRIKEFRLVSGLPFSSSPEMFPECITWSRSKLRCWDMDRIEAQNMYFQVRYLRNLCKQF